MRVLSVKSNLTQRAFPLLILFAVTAGLLLLGAVATAEAKDVTIRGAEASELQGQYTIIAYGCESTSDSPSLAILKKEGTGYDFEVEVSTPAYFWNSPQIPSDTQTLSGVPAMEALRRAENFVKCNPEVQDVELNRITGPQGTVLGYEVRPVYMPLRYGSAGLQGVTYSLEERDIIASVSLNPLAEKNDWGGG